jgi:hypothetical protein
MTEKDEAARQLAEAHYAYEPGLTTVIRIVSPSAEMETRTDEPIKLLEVNENSIATGIVPLHFGPDPARGIQYPSTIIEITPSEFRDLETNQICLPNGWRLDAAIPRPVI